MKNLPITTPKLFGMNRNKSVHDLLQELKEAQDKHYLSYYPHNEGITIYFKVYVAEKKRATIAHYIRKNFDNIEATFRSDCGEKVYVVYDQTYSELLDALDEFI